MEEPTNPKNSKFLEDLQKASQEIEADLGRKKSPVAPQPEVKEAPPKPPLEKGFDQDLAIQAEEVAKEKKRLEEIQRNLERNQKIVADCIQELTTIEGEISKVLGGKKKIDGDLQKLREKNQKIFEELKDPESFWFPK